MPLLYESYAKLEPNDTVTVFFETKTPIEAEVVKKRIMQYNWHSKGLQLVNFTVQKSRGNITLRRLPTFIIEPITWIAIASIVASATGLIGTIAKMWVVAQVANPLLAPGPLGFPMVFWLIIAAAGVLIPLAIILRRK